MVLRLAALQGLLGDAGNKRTLRLAVYRLVVLRRYEQLRLAQALHRVRGACMPALLPPMPTGALVQGVLCLLLTMRAAM